MRVPAGLSAAALALLLVGCTGSSPADPAPSATSAPSTTGATPPAAGTGMVPWKDLPVPPEGPVMPAALLVDDVTVDIITDGAGQPGPRFRFAVRLGNTSGQDISLTPCPSYRVGLAMVVETGMLNCAGGPDVIPAHGYVDYAMEVGINQAMGSMTGASLSWHLGGEPTDQVAPGALVTMPWT